MKLSKIIILSLLVIAVVVASFGCQAAQRPEPVRYDRTQDGGAGTGFDLIGNRGFEEDPMTLPGDQRLRNEARNGRINGGGFNNLGLRDNADLMDGGLGRGGAQGDISRRLEQRVEQIAGVRDATVVVEGNTVYVGLDLDRNAQQGMQGVRNGQQLRNNQGMQGARINQGIQGARNGQGMDLNIDRARTGQNNLRQAQDNNDNDVEQIKQQVRQVLAQEGQFRNFVISEERNFTRDLGGIANEMRTGRPVADFGDALRDLGRAITPAPTRTR